MKPLSKNRTGVCVGQCVAIFVLLKQQQNDVSVTPKASFTESKGPRGAGLLGSAGPLSSYYLARALPSYSQGRSTLLPTVIMLKSECSHSASILQSTASSPCQTWMHSSHMDARATRDSQPLSTMCAPYEQNLSWRRPRVLDG